MVQMIAKTFGRNREELGMALVSVKIEDHQIWEGMKN
jgi:hypothetical protein